MKNKTVLASAIFLFPFLCSCNSAKTSDNATWRVYGGGPDNIRYSTLNQINRDNVKQLQVQWTFDTDEVPLADQRKMALCG